MTASVRREAAWLMKSDNSLFQAMPVQCQKRHCTLNFR